MYSLIKSVKRPSAKTTTSMQLPIQAETGRTGPAKVLDDNKAILGIYYYLFCLLEISGSRFNEICKASFQLISSEGLLLIKASKGSQDRVVKDVRCTGYLLDCKSKSIDPFRGCNISTANRFLSQIGLFKQKKGRSNLTISGIFRDMLANEIRQVQKDDLTVTRSLGHRSSKSTEAYGKD